VFSFPNILLHWMTVSGCYAHLQACIPAYLTVARVQLYRLKLVNQSKTVNGQAHELAIEIINTQYW